MEYQVLNMHGFSVNKMYDNNKRSSLYNQWTTDMLEIMKSLPSLEELNVDPAKPMKIDITFFTIRGVDIDNLIKSFLDVLVKHYNLEDDNNFVDIHFRRATSFVNDKKDGSIMFNIENCKGLIMNEFDKLYLDIKYNM